MGLGRKTTAIKTIHFNYIAIKRQSKKNSVVPFAILSAAGFLFYNCVLVSNSAPAMMLNLSLICIFFNALLSQGCVYAYVYYTAGCTSYRHHTKTNSFFVLHYKAFFTFFLQNTLIL